MTIYVRYFLNKKKLASSFLFIVLTIEVLFDVFWKKYSKILIDMPDSCDEDGVVVNMAFFAPTIAESHFPLLSPRGLIVENPGTYNFQCSARIVQI